MTANLQNPIFTDETQAREWLEARVWPNGPVCPHCGATGDDVTGARGKTHRPGLYQCAACREQFTVTVKTVFERSKIPLSKWLAALFLLTASKKGRVGPSSAPLARRFVQVELVHDASPCAKRCAPAACSRRWAARAKSSKPTKPISASIHEDELMPRAVGPGKTKVGKRTGMRRPAYRAVLALVERGGKARTFHIAQADQNTVHAIMKDNITKETRIHTDESDIYKIAPWHFEKHETDQAYSQGIRARRRDHQYR